MSKVILVEVACDYCTAAIGHYHQGNVDADARQDGAIISRDGHHFCDQKCRRAWREDNKL